MSSKRPTILMGVLLVILLGYFAIQQIPPAPQTVAHPDPPLPGKTSVSNLRVHQDAMGAWIADFDYFYTGEPRSITTWVETGPRVADPGTQIAGFPPNSAFVQRLVRGSHHVTIPLQYPGEQKTTNTVAVAIWSIEQRQNFATQQVDQVIDWPAFGAYVETQSLARNTPEQNLRGAQELIDTEQGPSISAAKTILEKLLQQNPRFAPAYIELSRVAMKTDGASAESLHQSETLLASALAIQPDSANAKILLGYVYAHQKRFKEAEELFKQAAATNPPNAWLWTNWGEMLEMQHQADPAIARYREAIARPITHDSFDRGRREAYRAALALLGRKKDLDAMEVLYKQQVADYGPGACYSTEYARFMLQIRGDTQGAIDLARRALNRDCNDEPAREVLGLAEYVKWAATAGPERIESLNEARIYLPAGPRPLYLLAASDRTAPAAKQLIASGESIEQKDNYGHTALWYAFENNDLAAARRLLTLHARPDTPAGEGAMPLALLPVMTLNLPAIRLLREYGVNYSTLRFRGMTAVEFAKQAHNEELLKALGDSGTTL